MEDSLDYRAMGSRVRELRTRLKLTQENLAEAVGVSSSFIGHIERGEKKSSLETVSRLAASLGSSMDYIVLGNNVRCDQQSCPLYVDLKHLIAAYGDEQEYSPHITRFVQ